MMEAHDAIKNLMITPNIRQPTILDYSADLSFGLSFGKLNFTLAGSLPIDADTPLSIIYKIVLTDAIEELKKTPIQFELVSRYMAWEAVGKPPYAAWYATNYPISFN